jgi:hypothetical protein
MLSLSEKVKRVLKHEHISQTELQYMVQHSAITRVGECNRRFHHWLLKTEGDLILDMKTDPQVGVGTVERTCPACEGNGCKTCNYWGDIRVQPQKENERGYR